MSTELKEKLLPTQESAPRTGDGIDYSMFYDPYAMIIIFPNVEGFEEEYEKEIEKDDLSEMLHDIFNKKTSEEFAHDCETEYPYTYRLYHAADDGPANQGILIDLARKSFIEIIYKRCGLVTYSYYSRDKDEILVKVMGGGENDHNLLVFAEQFKYNLQLKSDLDPRPEWADKPSAWTSFDDDKKDLFAHYDGRYGSRSPLRQKDRIKLTLDAIKEFIDIDFLAKKSGFAKEYYPLHDQQELKDLRDNWGRLGLWYSLYQPIEDIKNYFGEKVAMYFAWLGHYATWLAAPALIGLAVFISGLFMDADGDKPAKLYILICAAFAGVMAIWSSVFHEFWKRKESTYAVYWGTTNCEEVEPPRPDFQGVRQENPVTERFERYYDPKKRAMKLIVSLFGAACVVGLVIGTVMLLMNLKYGSSDPNIQMAAGILNSVQIKVFNIVYGILAVKMNDWENHRTETEYEDNLVLKIFLFQFINSYISFFYVAFVYPIVNADHCESKESTSSALNFFGMAADTDNHDDTDGNTGGPHISCDFMGALAMQLGTVFIINVGMNAVELGLPFFMTWLEKKREEAALKDAKNVTRTFLFPSEEQSKLAGYEGTMGDYLEMAIQFGYVTMFCVGFPLVPTLAFFNNMLEIRIDAFKLCNLQQRPVPALAKDIGTWGGIIGVIATIAVVSNIGLVLFTANLLEGRAMWLKLAIFIILEHIVFIIKAIIAEGIADTPEDTEDLHARHDIIIKREYYGFSEENEEQLNQKLTKIAAVYDVDDDDLKDCKKLE